MTKLKFMLLIIATLTTYGLITTEPAAAATGSLTQQCSTAIQQLISCLDFAKGVATAPTKQCCTSVSGMKEKQPVCLCFFIGQAHNGSQEIKSLGIQEDKLLQLPSECKLTDADASNCPMLLGISPSSPAASIFKNNGTSSSSTKGSSSSSSSSNNLTGASSDSSKAKQGVLTTLMAVFVCTLLCALPVATLM